MALRDLRRWWGGTLGTTKKPEVNRWSNWQVRAPVKKWVSAFHQHWSQYSWRRPSMRDQDRIYSYQLKNLFSHLSCQGPPRALKRDRLLLEGITRVPQCLCHPSWHLGSGSPLSLWDSPSFNVCLQAGHGRGASFWQSWSHQASWLAFVAFLLVGLTSRQKVGLSWALLVCLEVKKQGWQQWLSVLYEPWPVCSHVGFFLPPQLDLHY